jgi:DNA (cytosine-5)-methyltransferase 1
VLIKLYKWGVYMLNIEIKKLTDYKFIDLFAGLGGFRLALESYGAECVYSSEWDKEAQIVYKSNFGEKPDGDITKVDEKSIPNHDILCAGFPCQAFSISGKQRGFEDSRGTLFFDVARIVKEKKPKIVFMENVKNFASHDNGNTLSVVKQTMIGLGYDFYYKVLNAMDYGIPQKRERIYMVCFRKDLKVNDFCFPEAFKLETFVEDLLIDENKIPASLYVDRKDMHYSQNEIKENLNKTIRIGTVNKGGQGERIYSTKGIAITLSANGGGVFAKTGGYLVNGKPRRLHPRECARLMGYPDTYKMSKKNNQAYKQFGNSVVIDVLQYIVGSIADCLNS